MAPACLVRNVTSSAMGEGMVHSDKTKQEANPCGLASCFVLAPRPGQTKNRDLVCDLFPRGETGRMSWPILFTDS
jgi:hypothetical protein